MTLDLPSRPLSHLPVRVNGRILTGLGVAASGFGPAQGFATSQHIERIGLLLLSSAVDSRGEAMLEITP